MEHSQALAGGGQQIWLPGYGIHNHPMSRNYGTKQMGLTVYVQINTKGAELRQAMATSRQHPAPLIVDPRISKLPGGVLTSD